jgi:hypothetical protein
MNEMFGGLGHASLHNFKWHDCWMVSDGEADSNFDKCPVQTYEAVFGDLNKIIRAMDERMNKLTAIFGCLCFTPVSVTGTERVRYSPEYSIVRNKDSKLRE